MMIEFFLFRLLRGPHPEKVMFWVTDVVYVLLLAGCLYGKWHILKTAGRKPWHCLIPFLGNWDLYDLCWDGRYGIAVSAMYSLMNILALGSGVIIVKDEVLQIEDDLVLVGREDVSNLTRIPLKDLAKREEGTYVIWTDHSPYQNEEIREANADLQLSGHTHAGQIFPIRWLYTLAGLNVVYTYRIADTDLYVSPGIGNWYYPFRNETHCSYAMIDLIQK